MIMIIFITIEDHARLHRLSTPRESQTALPFARGRRLATNNCRSSYRYRVYRLVPRNNGAADEDCMHSLEQRATEWRTEMVMVIVMVMVTETVSR